MTSRPALEEEYGEQETAYRRWEAGDQWGLWRLILDALGEGQLPGPATKES